MTEDNKIDPSNEEIKKAMKEGIKEWLNEQYAAFGKWTLHGLLAMALAGICWLAFQGYFHK